MLNERNIMTLEPLHKRIRLARRALELPQLESFAASITRSLKSKARI
jgi:hypothetical protein